MQDGRALARVLGLGHAQGSHPGEGVAPHADRAGVTSREASGELPGGARGGQGQPGRQARRRRSRRCTDAAHVRPQQEVDEERHRPAVEQHVVVGHDEPVPGALAGADPDDDEPQQRRTRQVERTVELVGHDLVEGSAHGVGVRVVEVPGPGVPGRVASTVRRDAANWGREPAGTPLAASRAVRTG